MRHAYLVYGLIFLFTQCAPAQTKQKDMNEFDFENAWSKVKAKENEGLPESALQLVNEIGEHAKAEKNSGQLVKVIIHQLKFADAKEEDAFVKNMVKLKAEAEQASFPAKPLLHSMLAELYWQYYQNNRYEFINRSATVNVDEQDIETWSLSKIVAETQKQYALSLLEAERSKKERIDIYTPVIHQGNRTGRTYRPTLFDF